MLLLIRRAAYPHVARLGRIPGTSRYSDLDHHPDNDRLPGVLILRVEAGLFYFNAGHVRDEVRRLLAASGDGLRLVVWDLSTSPNVDIAGVRLIRDVLREVTARGATLRVVDAHSAARDLIRKEVGTSVGEVSRRISIDDALAERR
jgi:MFS superfamily sulfate permease-like transporter